MKSCILPFAIDVEVRAYHNKAFPLGIAKANMADYDIWICNKLINSLFAIKGTFNSYDEDVWSVNDGFISKRIIDLPPDKYDCKGIDIIALNKEMIEDGLYITGDYNEFYIKGKNAYNNYDFDHDYVIFGFDDEKKVFKSAAYLSDGSYGFYDIEYENYYKSIINSKRDSVNVRYIQVNKNYIPTLDIQFIKEKTHDYLNSRKDTQEIETENRYGMVVWDKFVEYIISVGENNLSCRYGRVYMEHRALMLKRMRKLLELGYFNDVELCEAYLKNVYMPAKTVHYLFIKYNETKSLSIISQIIEIVRKANKREDVLLRKLLAEL